MKAKIITPEQIVIFGEIDLNKNYLVEFNDNYADEFDVDEFVVMDGNRLHNIFDKLENYDERISFYFGTNEDLEYDCGQDFLDRLTIKEISDSDNQVLLKLFGGGFGGVGAINHIETRSFLNKDENGDDYDDNQDEDFDC